MTVEQLIALLNQLPPSTPVYTDGCDCVGLGVGILYEKGWSLRDPEILCVLIVREGNEYLYPGMVKP